MVEHAFFSMDQKNDLDPTINACIFGGSGEGKTGLGTSLLWGTPRFGNKAAYVAWDQGSEKMTAISPENREHLIKMNPERNAKGYDPDEAAFQIATMDYKAVDPEIGTIIWDTGSELGDELLRWYANKGYFASRKAGATDPHVQIGKPGTKSQFAMPMEGDYGAAQQGVLRIIQCLLNQPLSVIFICQPEVYIPKSGTVGGEIMGGPGMAGGKSVLKVAPKFDSVIRVSGRSRDTIGTDGKPIKAFNYKAFSERRGIWVSKLRMDPTKKNPMTEVDITHNPRKFWEEFEKSVPTPEKR